MSEHGWDQADDPDVEHGYEHHDVLHDDVLHDDVLHDEDAAPDEPAWAGPDEPLPVDPHDPDLPYEHHEPVAHAEVAEPPPAEVVGADPDALPEADTGGDPTEVFPPIVDVGPLPEPVDGFPWIDTGSLGLVGAGPIGAGPVDAGPVDAGTAHPAPDPRELAEYAAEELPPGQDPWAALAGSDDPATRALVRFYAPPTDPA